MTRECDQSSLDRMYLHPGQVEVNGGGALGSLPGAGDPPGDGGGTVEGSIGYKYCVSLSSAQRHWLWS